MTAAQHVEAAAFLLFVSLGGVFAYRFLLALGLGDGLAGILAGGGVGVIAIAWVLLRMHTPRLG